MELLQLLPLLGVAVLFYLLILRPAQRRTRELVSMQASLKVGDGIVLTSGVYGTLTRVAEDHVFVEIAEGVTIKVALGAVGSVQHHPEPTNDSTDASETDSAARSEDN